MMVKKAWRPKYSRRVEQQVYLATYVKINPEKTKDLNRKTWNDEIAKENKKMLPKTEKGKGLLFCFI